MIYIGNNQINKLKMGSQNIEKVYLEDQVLWEGNRYTRVEYLRSTGTQIILTDILPDATHKYELDLMFGTAGSNPNRGFFGTIEIINGALHSRYNANWGSNSNTSVYVYVYENTTASETVILSSIRTTRNTLSISTSARRYGSATLSSPAITLPTNISLPLALFGVIEGSSINDFKPFAQSAMTLYGFKVYGAQDVLLHNLIPVERISDGELGLYDTITDNFYTNSGTGIFIKGNYVNNSNIT